MGKEDFTIPTQEQTAEFLDKLAEEYKEHPLSKEEILVRLYRWMKLPLPEERKEMI